MTSDLDYLFMASMIARHGSHDLRTQNGALLVCGSEHAGAANVYPVSAWRNGEKLIAPRKYDYIEHAERGAIYDAARRGLPTVGSTMYAIWFSCPECARAIIAAGVSAVVGSLAAREATPGRWKDDVSRGESMLRDAGVGMRWVADKLHVSILFDGKELYL